MLIPTQDSQSKISIELVVVVFINLMQKTNFFNINSLCHLHNNEDPKISLLIICYYSYYILLSNLDKSYDKNLYINLAIH